MAKMTNIFARAWQKNLKGVVLYLKAADGILYYTKVSTTYSNPVSKAELIDLFQKGLVVVDTGSGQVRPTALTVSTNYAAVSHTTVGASDKAVATSYYSDGYEA